MLEPDEDERDLFEEVDVFPREEPLEDFPLVPPDFELEAEEPPFPPPVFDLDPEDFPPLLPAFPLPPEDLPLEDELLDDDFVDEREPLFDAADFDAVLAIIYSPINRLQV